MTKNLLEQSLGEDSAPILAEMERFNLSDEAQKKILLFCQELQAYNEHTNLVSNAKLDVVYKEHVLDSLTLLHSIEEDHPASLIDIGSGAGFPALILAIARPQLHVSLVESIGKKCRFLEQTITKLDLDNDRVRVLCERAELLAHKLQLRETFDYATARAVAALPIVSELTLPFLKVGGVFLAQRSKRQAVQEQDEAEAYIAKLGGEIFETEFLPHDLLGRELSIILIEKTKSTPSRFPRSSALIQKDKKSSRGTAG